MLNKEMICLREINISGIISAKRREKGITQDELAEYMGVSKASVSKWETAQSYPDITLLPRLAAFFNISIDELVGYQPQMTKEDVRKNYNRLSHAFSCKPFEEVYKECHELTQKYYSCFPLVFKMAALLLNHYPLEKDMAKQEAIVKEIVSLCEHVKRESDDVWLSKQANSLQAVCCLILQKPLEVLELLEGTTKPVTGDEVVLASAFQMIGQVNKAKSALQISTYQNVIHLLGLAPSYLSLYMQEKEKFEVILNRFINIAYTFEFDKLRPDLMATFYYTAAVAYAGLNEPVKTLEMIDSYSTACTSENFAVFLHGDSFFDLLDEWLEEFDMNKSVPRDIKVIKHDVLKIIKENPAFAFLKNDPAYKNIINNLELKLNGGN